jgi:WD40 repeat protein
LRVSANQEEVLAQLRDLKNLFERGIQVSSLSMSTADALEIRMSRNLSTLAYTAQVFHSHASSTATTIFGGKSESTWGGSDIGGLTDYQLERIKEWSHVALVEENVGDEATNGPDLGGISATTATVEIDSGRHTETHSDGNEDSHDDDLDLSSSLEELAILSFHKADYGKSLQYLLELMEHSKFKKSSKVDNSKILTRMSLCQCLMNEWDVAAITISDIVIKQKGVANAVYNIRHAISIQLLASGKLDEAYNMCNDTLRGQKRILGTDGPDYTNSLSLLARIWEKKGDHIKAEAIRHTIQKTMASASEPDIEYPAAKDMSPKYYLLSHKSLLTFLFDMPTIADIGTGDNQTSMPFDRQFDQNGDLTLQLPQTEQVVTKKPDGAANLAISSINGKWRQVQKLTGHDSGVVSVAFSPDGNRLASGCWEKSVRIWAVDVNGEWQQTQELTSHESQVWSVAFSPDGSRLASGSWDKTIRIWAMDANNKWRQTQKLTSHESEVWSVAFSPDGSRLASGSWDKTIRIWATDKNRKWRQIQKLTGHGFGVLSVAFSPDSSRLASGSADKTIRIWAIDVNGGWRQVGKLTGHESNVLSVAFSPDGSRLISSSGDTTVRIWAADASNEWRQVEKLGSHGSNVWSVALSPDGSQLASGSGDKTVQIWTVDMDRKWRHIQKLECPESGIWSVAFSPDGSRLASGHGDKSVRIWVTDANG